MRWAVRAPRSLLRAAASRTGPGRHGACLAAGNDMHCCPASGPRWHRGAIRAAGRGPRPGCSHRGRTLPGHPAGLSSASAVRQVCSPEGTVTTSSSANHFPVPLRSHLLPSLRAACSAASSAHPSSVHLAGPCGWLFHSSVYFPSAGSVCLRRLSCDGAICHACAAPNAAGYAAARFGRGPGGTPEGCRTRGRQRQAQGLKLPTLYLRATEDRLIPRSAGEYFSGLAQAGRVVDLEGPHFLLQARPRLAAAQVRKFIDSL